MKNNFKDNLILNNPVMVQTFGLVSVLALSNSLLNALVMGVGVIFVMLCSNIFVTIFKKIIDEELEYIAYMSIITAFSIVAINVTQKFFPSIANNMGIYLYLLPVNSLILHRVRTYAIFQNIKNSVLDAISNGLGYLFIIVEIAFVRELFGMGSLFGKQIIPVEYTLPIFSTHIFAFIVVGLYIAFYNWFVRNQKLKGARR